MVNVTIPLAVTQNLTSGRAGKYVKFHKKKKVAPSEPSFQVFALATHINIILNACCVSLRMHRLCINI